MRAVIDVILPAEDRAPRGVVEADDVIDDADPVVDEHTEIRTDKDAVGLLVMRIVKSDRRLMAVELTGDDVRIEHHLAMLEERQLLVVKIDLDIGIADGEQLAVPVADSSCRYAVTTSCKEMVEVNAASASKT